METYFLIFYLLYGSKNRKKEYYFAEHFWSEMHDGKNKVKLSHNPLERIILSLVWKDRF